MNLVVDFGNSAVKAGIFDHHNLVEKSIFKSLDKLEQYIHNASFEYLIVSSVNAGAEKISSWAHKARKTFVLNPSLPIPVQNLYATPSTLGMDRLAGVCGAWQLFPGQASLVIDAGTCITYDSIDSMATYRGGSISPGLEMRFKALHTLTAKLPLVSPAEKVALIGKNTETSIQSGVVNGMLAEIHGIIHQYNEIFSPLNVILCGGDAGFFENQVKASIFASPELVLIGLNSILIYNVKHS